MARDLLVVDLDSSFVPPPPSFAMGHPPLAESFSANISLLYDLYLERYPERVLRWLLSRPVNLRSLLRRIPDFRPPLASLCDILNAEIFLLSTLPLTFCIVLLFYLLYSLTRKRSRRIEELSDSPCLRAPLDALLEFLTPTSSVWPERYLCLAQQSLVNGSSNLKLPLGSLLHDILHGTVELRHPTTDLPAFILHSHHSHEWPITPSIGIWWRARVAFQLLCLRLSPFYPSKSPLPVLPDFSRASYCDGAAAYTDASGDHEARAKALPTTRPLPAMTMVVLDAIPYSCLPAYVRSFQHALPPGASAMLGFSTYCDKPSFTCGAFVHAAIPFLARQYVTKNAANRSGNSNVARCPSLDVQPTPLLTSLDGILRLITSGSSPLVVESVQNVSEQYASYLDRYSQELTDLPKVREKFVAQWGMAGWREERLMVTWEAALFRAGLMSRWVVLVTRNEYA